jgi:hypothetical protein
MTASFEIQGARAVIDQLPAEVLTATLALG